MKIGGSRPYVIKASNPSSSAITKVKKKVVTLVWVDSFLRELAYDLHEEIREMNATLREVDEAVKEIQGVANGPIEFETTVLRRM